MPVLALVASDLVRGALRAAAVLALAFVVAAFLAGASLAALVQAATGRGPDAPAAATPIVPPGEPIDAAVVAIARLYLRMPYVWGGADPTTSFDCSGLVQWAYARVGVRLPRTAQQQHDATAPGGDQAQALRLFLGVAVMVLTLKVPDLMRSGLGDGLGFYRSYVYRQAGRALEGIGAGVPPRGGR